MLGIRWEPVSNQDFVGDLFLYVCTFALNFGEALLNAYNIRPNSLAFLITFISLAFLALSTLSVRYHTSLISYIVV
jgi:hypothetical protein